MDFRQLYIVALVVSGVLAIGMAAWVQARGRGESARAFILFLLVGSLWPFSLALQATTWNDDLSYWFFVFRILVEWGVPPLWFGFVLIYTGRRDWLSRPVLGFVVGEYLLAAVLLLTTRQHHLMYHTIEFPADWTVPMADAGEAIGYSIHIVFVYAYVILGLVVLFRQFLTSRHGARSQIVSLMLAMVIPFGLNITNNLVDMPGDHVKYAALGVGIFAIFAGWGMFTQQLFTTAPLARDTVLELIDEGIVVVDRQWSIVDYNARASASFPALAGGVGDRIDDVVPSLVSNPDRDDPDRFADRVTVATDDERADFEVTASSLGGQEGKRRGCALILEDVTDVEQYQATVQQQNKRLEHVAKTISHDLRNPVNVAEGFLQIARDQEDFEKLDRVERAIGRIDEITDEVLTLARQEQAIGEREPVVLARVVQDAWEMSDTASATLETDLGGGQVYADDERLQTAFENLFRNAVDHGPDDVTVRVGRFSGGFYVEDDGPGIPEDERDEVFEYEYTTADDGTGLGLFTVQTVAEGHGWGVEATESEVGGARFEFSGVSFVADAGDHSARSSAPGD